MLRLCIVSSEEQQCFLMCSVCSQEVRIIFDHSAVLLTLGLAVELVGIGLAEVLFVGHTQTDGGVKGPDVRLPCAGLGRHGQTAHSLSATSLQTLSLTVKVVLVAQTTSKLEELAAH